MCRTEQCTPAVPERQVCTCTHAVPGRQVQQQLVATPVQVPLFLQGSLAQASLTSGTRYINVKTKSVPENLCTVISAYTFKTGTAYEISPTLQSWRKRSYKMQEKNGVIFIFNRKCCKAINYIRLSYISKNNEQRKSSLIQTSTSLDLVNFDSYNNKSFKRRLLQSLKNNQIQKLFLFLMSFNVQRNIANNF